MRASVRRLLSCLAAVAALGPRAADACGGTFCDTGPQAMPVDQSGENILFVLDGGTVEAHVQIQYQGSAERFAWVVPMPAVPDVTVGSQPLFTRLLAGTVPTYALQTQADQCGAGGSGGGVSFDGGFSGSGGSSGAGGGPQVVFEKTVGAFEVVVLQGGTAVEVVSWLQNNNYQTISTAPQILQDYVAQSYVFVAVKLTAGAGLDEIHPLVFKYTGTEPCIPLKLTRVAATEDMAVRAFFLGDDRVVPTNYKHVVLNPVRVDWVALGANYKQVISRGADSAVANGRAFFTEYAGSSNVVGTPGVYSAAWNAAPFATLQPEQVITELQKQGLVYCSTGSNCSYMHPLIQGILADFLPVPAGMKDYDFYGCLSCNSALIDKTKWNAGEFSAAVQTRIVDPAKHAKALLDKWPYLTRLYTTISPAEMTEDPMFRAAPGEQTVQPNNTAVQRITCDGKRGVLLPDDRQVALAGSQWPAWDSQMPWAEEIEEYTPSGKITLVDNTKKIDALLAEWNQKQGWPPPTGSGGGGAGGAGSGGSSSGTGGGNSGSGSTEVEPGGGGGCGVGARPSGALAWLGLGALALALRRRGQRQVAR